MKPNHLFFGIAIAATIALFGILFYLPLIGCNGEPACCPEWIAFGPTPEYICDPQKFSGQNTITLAGTIKYSCPPAKYSVTLLEDNKMLTPPKVNKSGDTYQVAPFTRTVNKSIWYELTAFCDSKTVTERKQVKIISDKPEWSYFELCTSSPDADKKGNSPVWEFPPKKNYGKGIVIGSIENISDYEVDVKYKTSGCTLPRQSKSPCFQGKQLGYGWQISMKQQEYDKMIKMKKDVCVKVHLICQPG